jgi:hypothetical protein
MAGRQRTQRFQSIEFSPERGEIQWAPPFGKNIMMFLLIADNLYQHSPLRNADKIFLRALCVFAVK